MAFASNGSRPPTRKGATSHTGWEIWNCVTDFGAAVTNCGNGQDGENPNLQVAGPPCQVDITPVELPNSFVGQQYSQKLTVVGGTPQTSNITNGATDGNRTYAYDRSDDVNVQCATTVSATPAMSIGIETETAIGTDTASRLRVGE